MMIAHVYFEKGDDVAVEGRQVLRISPMPLQVGAQSLHRPVVQRRLPVDRAIGGEPGFVGSAAQRGQGQPHQAAGFLDGAQPLHGRRGKEVVRQHGRLAEQLDRAGLELHGMRLRSAR